MKARTKSQMTERYKKLDDSFFPVLSALSFMQLIDFFPINCVKDQFGMNRTTFPFTGFICWMKIIEACPGGKKHTTKALNHV